MRYGRNTDRSLLPYGPYIHAFICCTALIASILVDNGSHQVLTCTGRNPISPALSDHFDIRRSGGLSGHFALHAPPAHRTSLLDMRAGFWCAATLLVLLNLATVAAETNDAPAATDVFPTAEKIAADAIKAALENDPNNMALLRMLQSVYQQQIDLIERVHAPKWQQI